MSDDFTPTPEFEQHLRAALPAPAPEAAFVRRLHARLMAQAAEMKPAPSPRRWSLRWAYIVLLVLLLAVVFSPQIVTAMRRLLGYVPGVGLVEQNAPIRVLAEPVVARQAGFTVTLLEVVAASNRTFVVFQIDGIPPTREGFPVCGIMPLIRLPDGSGLEFMNSGGGGGMESEGGQPMSFKTDFTYSPLPAGVETVTFVLPCILPKPGTGPENWEIPLKLVPAPADFATPGVEIDATAQSSGPKFATTPTPTLEISTAQGPAPTLDASALPTPTSVPNGSGLYLEKVIDLEQSYILVGNFTDAGDLPGQLLISGASDYVPHIEDAQGDSVDFKLRTDIQPVTNWGGVYYWAYEIPKPVAGPLTITLERVKIDQSDIFQFQFDTGPESQVGQRWSLNRSFTLSGYNYTLDTVERLPKGYLFNWHSGLDIPDEGSFSLNLLDLSPSLTEGANGVEDHRPKERVNYSQSFLTDEPILPGVLTVELILYRSVALPGPWTLTWSPPQP
jgi:hypothetical protein